MSDAERAGDRRRERLDWGEKTDAVESADPETASERPNDHGRERPDDEPAADDGESREGELCVIEDPTCEACQ